LEEPRLGKIPEMGSLMPKKLVKKLMEVFFLHMPCMEYIHLYMKHVGLFGSVIWIHDDIARITIYFNVQLSNPPFFPCQWKKPGGKKTHFHQAYGSLVAEKEDEKLN